MEEEPPDGDEPEAAFVPHDDDEPPLQESVVPQHTPEPVEPEEALVALPNISLQPEELQQFSVMRQAACVWRERHARTRSSSQWPANGIEWVIAGRRCLSLGMVCNEGRERVVVRDR